MAKEYIEREAALEKQIGVVVYDEGGWDANVRAVPVDAIENIPAADVVEVVRCKDCKHRGTDECVFHVKGEPADEELLIKLDNDFCSYGERRDSE